MHLGDGRRFTNREFYEPQPKPVGCCGPGNDYILDELCSNIHPLDANMITVVRVMQAIIVEINHFQSM